MALDPFFTQPKFLPEVTNLSSVNELQKLSHTITYVDSFGLFLPVTIVAEIDNPTLIVSGNTIQGHYSEAFEHFVRYRTKQDTLVEVRRFREVNLDELYGIYHYDADNRLQIVYNYTATASNGASKQYTITVTSNWTPGRNELLRAVNNAFYEKNIKARWINNNNQNTPWRASAGTVTDWENDTWPSSW